MHDSGEDLHWSTGIAHSRDHSQDRRISVSTVHSNIASEAMAHKLALPTTSKSLNAILCPVTAEIENQLARSGSGQVQGLQQVAYGADVVGIGFWKSASRQKRYHPYAKGKRGSQSSGIDIHSINSLIGHKSRFYMYSDRERCTTQPQNRVDDEFCRFLACFESLDNGGRGNPALRRAEFNVWPSNVRQHLPQVSSLLSLAFLRLFPSRQPRYQH
ncbi:hypothetical protein JOM56_008044 [Amanita muscaria]